ncbi:ARF/SAR superfamily protein [Tieghemostelium lacteum]|uniref:ARF/SAR superfamily protein n=1 Tax=Tieghemostelium lacteum TaxID=361077 RepID=A0A151ZK28_TIELA|nr:ARF/SAR superfamily protein [Tieghemostelium lacteum]|eukprot:KYQ94352.1 ARF/SAR superfamily protein [Tieghemostelium lacteum]
MQYIDHNDTLDGATMHNMEDIEKQLLNSNLNDTQEQNQQQQQHHQNDNTSNIDNINTSQSSTTNNNNNNNNSNNDENNNYSSPLHSPTFSLKNSSLTTGTTPPIEISSNNSPISTTPNLIRSTSSNEIQSQNIISNNGGAKIHHRQHSLNTNNNNNNSISPISTSPISTSPTLKSSVSSTSIQSLALKKEKEERLANFKERIATCSFLELFSLDVLNLIFVHVGALDMTTLIQVSKICFKIGMNEKLWAIFVQNDYKITEINEINQLKKLNGSIRSLYANLYFKKKNSITPPSSPNPLIKYFLRPISKIPNLFQRKEYKILMYGLNGVGKTTTLYKFARGENVRTLHTNGYNVEVVEYKSCDFICWDIGYEQSIVPVWHHYLQDTQAIIFIIDSCDRQRIRLVKEELWKLVTDKNVIKIINNFKQPQNQENLSRIKVLIYANKIDSINPMTTLEITLALSLFNLPKNISWHVQGCSATSEDGDGLYEGLDWLSSQYDH